MLYHGCVRKMELILALSLSACAKPTPVEQAQHLVRMHREEEAKALLRKRLAEAPDDIDARRMLVAISCGGVWETLDAGESWKLHGRGMIASYLPPEQAGTLESQDPHRVVRCAEAPDTMWMQHHCGIFRSVDSGRTWTQLKPPGDDFGFAVAAHPKDPLTAWFVPAVKDEMRVPRDGRFAVTRTRDGGRTWQTLRAGLPQRDAYDLVYRHGLDVDAEGRHDVILNVQGDLPTLDPHLVRRAAEALAKTGALHLYGKRESRPGRKMGHVTRLKPLTKP